MMSAKHTFFNSCCTVIVAWLGMVNILLAAQFGDFTYSDNGSSITITKFSNDLVGDLMIPASIDGKPVTSIGSSAFTVCSSLTRVTIPSSVTNIGSKALTSCIALTTITVAPLNPAYASADGILFNKAMTTLIQCPQGRAGNIAIPAGTTSIGDDAFYSCHRLTGVTLPTSITSIGARAFYHCPILTNVAVPTSVTSIGFYAFVDCVSLTSISIPASVNSIGEPAFFGCSSLAAITVDPMNLDYASADGFLFNKAMTTLIQCPGGKAGSVILPTSVTSIKDYAFAYCSNLTSVTLPSNVTSIGIRALYDCYRLTSVNLPSKITSIGISAFSGCTRLTNITLPASLTSIGKYAFSRCESLTGMTIPASVTSIGDSAFDQCTSQTTITVATNNPIYASVNGILFNKSKTTLIQCPGGKSGSITIPSSVTTIEGYAFWACSSLTSITFPANLTTISSYAFVRCSSLTNIFIPAKVTSIGFSVFTGCTSLTTITVDAGNLVYTSANGILFNKNMTKLICCPGGNTGSVTIPPSVADIGENAFNTCTRLTGVEIPASVTSISLDAFSRCSNLTAITVDLMNLSYTSSDGILFDKNMTFLIHYPEGKIGSVTIPASVTRTGTYAFTYCTNLTGVSIPPSVTDIGSEAFSFCPSLATITVDPMNPAYASANGILFNKNMTTLIRCPEDKAGNVPIPASVTNVGFRAFANCSGLTSAIFLGDAPSIFWGHYVFSSFYASFYANAPSFTIYFFDGKLGFTSPTWMSFPSVSMGAPSAISPWLLTNGFAYNANLNSDLNGDGVNLLMAYALHLDPNKNLGASMPKVAVAGNQMSLSFYAGAEGITYAVQSSIDLQNWESKGVTLSAPDANALRSATVEMTEPKRYMRLVVAAE